MISRSLTLAFDVHHVMQNRSSGKNGNAVCLLTLIAPNATATPSPEKISTRAACPTPANIPAMIPATFSAKTVISRAFLYTPVQRPQRPHYPKRNQRARNFCCTDRISRPHVRQNSGKHSGHISGHIPATQLTAVPHSLQTKGAGGRPPSEVALYATLSHVH